jgi:hypothetical protein
VNDIGVSGESGEGCGEGVGADAAPALQGAGTGCRCLACGDVGLVKVIEAWPRLPEYVRLAIVAHVSSRRHEASNFFMWKEDGAAKPVTDRDC